MRLFETACPSCGQMLKIDCDRTPRFLPCPSCGVRIEFAEGIDERKDIPEAVETAPEHAPKNAGLWLFVFMVGFVGWGPFFFTSHPLFIFSNASAAFLLTGFCAVFSTVVLFYGFLLPRGVPAGPAIGAFLFTAIPGILMLLLLQMLGAKAVHAKIVYAGSGTAWLAIVKFYGQCWEWLNSSAGFLKQLTGFIFAVGIFEELTKLIPLVALLRWSMKQPAEGRTSFRAFVFVGFLSGIGFGVAEALLQYSPWASVLSANPRIFGMPFSNAAVRWFSCVPLHGIWGAADAAFLWQLAPMFARSRSMLLKFGVLVMAVFGVAVLHGVYDILCANHIFGAGISVLCALLLPLFCRWMSRRTPASEPRDGMERSLAMYLKSPHARTGIFAAMAGGLFALFLAATPMPPAMASTPRPKTEQPKPEDDKTAEIPEPEITKQQPTTISLPAMSAVRCTECDGKSAVGCKKCGGAGFVLTERAIQRSVDRVQATLASEQKEPRTAEDEALQDRLHQAVNAMRVGKGLPPFPPRSQMTKEDGERMNAFLKENPIKLP